MRNFCLACLMLVTVCTTGFAEWRDHSELPDWCQRGNVRWTHGFSTMDVARVDMLLNLDQNLKQSGGFKTPEAAARAREGGLRFQPYICSKTINWEKLFETHPQLQEACCVDPSGKRHLMYGNPARYAGDYRDPRWRAYIKERIDQTVASVHPASIFFDNFNCYNPYNALDREEFPDFTEQLLGRRMTLDGSTADPRFAFAKLVFDARAALDFFNEMRTHLAEVSPTPVMVCPNCHVSVNWHVYLTSMDVNDLVFYEEGNSFPPFSRQVYGYKLGLAASHGKVVGQLLGLPPTVAEQRAIKRGEDWQFHQPEVQEAYTYPEEYQIAIAEGAACDATFIPSTNIREQKIRPGDEPYLVAIRTAMTKYYDFLVERKALYAGAQPGAKTAALYSIWTNLHNRKAQRVSAVCADLMRTGLPFEVITEDDLTAELLAPYQRLILPKVENLSDEDMAAVEHFARAGGRVMLIGDCAVADRLGVERPAEARADFWTSDRPAAPVGEGQVARLASWPDDLSGAQLRAKLDDLLGSPAACIEPSDTLALNLLRSADGEGLQAHLLNYDFRYDHPPTGEIADDNGVGHARTYLADTAWRARKILIVDDPAAIAEPVVRFFGNSPGTDFELVVSLNGKDLGSFPGTALRSNTWHEIDAAGALKAGENIVEYRVTGDPNSNPDYFNLRLDTDAHTGRSSWSTDGGASFTTEDLSPDRGEQTGEYLVRIMDRKQFRDTFTPEDFAGKLAVVPAEDVRVTVPARPGGWSATCLSPDHDPIALQPVTTDADSQVFVVPSVHIYELLLLRPAA